MAIPVLIDTDMGIDDAVAVALALASDAVEVRAIVGAAGRTPLDQTTVNISKVLGALSPPAMPLIGRGVDREAPPPADEDAALDADGLGDWDQPAHDAISASDFLDVYRQAADEAKGELRVLLLGPMTNVAAILDKAPALFDAVKRVYVAGGAVWAQGHAGGAAEFNFRCDPSAAAALMSSGLPITVVPRDVTGLVCLDQSHVAHMAASGYRTGEVSATLLEHSLESDAAPGYGKTFAPAAVAVGSLVWPDLFLKTRMRLEIVTSRTEAGRSKPALGGDKSKQVDLLTAVNAADFVENLLESLCHEAFIV